MTNVIKFCKIFYQNAKLSGTYGFFPTRQPYKRFRSAAIAFWRVSRQRWWIQFGRERPVPTTSALRRRSASFRGLSARKHTHEANIDMLNGMNSLERWQNAVVLILQKRITNRLWSFSASEVTTLSRYTNRFYYYYYYLAHQHKACRQLKISKKWLQWVSNRWHWTCWGTRPHFPVKGQWTGAGTKILIIIIIIIAAVADGLCDAVHHDQHVANKSGR